MKVKFAMLIIFIMSSCSFFVLTYESINTFVLDKKIITSGIVDTVYKSHGSEGGQYTTYIIDFSTRNNTLVKIENYFKSDDSRYKIGDNVNIIYSEEDPESARIDSYVEKYGGITFLCIFNVITWILGICIYKYPKTFEKLMNNAD